MKKRMTVVVVSMVAVLLMSGIVFGADETWPPQKFGVMTAGSCGDKLCALYPLTEGKVDIICATKTSTGFTNVVTNHCTPSGVKQVCSPSGVAVNHFDMTGKKCIQVCAPGCPTSQWKMMQ
jgi:hypothetical protein